jgi:hypothetical protein
MASTLSTILDTAGVAGTVYNITNDYKASAIAAGYSAFVNAITGSDPQITQPVAGKAKIILTSAQATTIRTYLETTAKNALNSQGGNLSIDLNPVIIPTATKWGLIAAIAAGSVGFLLAKYL